MSWLRSRSRLFIRSYLVLAGGLLIAAIVLDHGFGALQDRQTRAADPWLESSFRLIETELLAVSPGQRDAAARRLGERLGLEVRLLASGDVTAATRLAGGAQEVVDDAGRIHFLWPSPALRGLVRAGPFDPPADGWLMRFLPVVFYGSILLIVGLWLRPLLRDVRVLTDASQRFAADYREPVQTAARTTELTSLATHLDDMSARISQLIQSQKEMTAALSHEMRTPLARIRFAVAVLENQVEANVRAQLRAVNADVQQIDDLIADMLDYARLDHPGLRMQWQEVTLAPWLRQVLLSNGAAEKVTITLEAESAWMEPRLMELALSNLVSNALRHARTRVAVGLTRDGHDYRLVVEDDGDGIPASERDAVFRAFTRLDSSRNRDTGGFGLGLAIVARIAALHRGRVSAGASAKLGGARLALEWPAAARESQPAAAG